MGGRGGTESFRGREWIGQTQTAVKTTTPPQNDPDDPEHPDRQVEWVTVLRHGEQDGEGREGEQHQNLAGLVDSARY